MKLSEMIETFDLTIFSESAGDPELTRGYVSDLLSDVMANAGKDYLWLTMQTHVNIVAVAALKDIAAALIVGGHRPDPETVSVAVQKGVCLLGTGMAAFEAAGRLYEKGLRGDLT